MMKLIIKTRLAWPSCRLAVQHVKENNSQHRTLSTIFCTIKQCDQIGAPSVCGGPNSFNTVTPQLPNSGNPKFLRRFLCEERSGAKIEDFRSWGVKELGSCGVTELRSSDLHILNGAHPVWSPWYYLQSFL